MELTIINKFKKFIHFAKLDKLYEKFKKIDKNIIKKILILIILPILIYLYCQFLCNGKLIFERKRMLLILLFYWKIKT